MTWFIRAFSGVGSGPLYYSCISPAEFYEWRFLGYIPKGTAIYRKVPKREVLLENKIIVGVVFEDNIKSDENFILKSNSRASVFVKAGRIPSVEEVIEEFKIYKNKSDKMLESFKESTLEQKYFTSLDEEPCLYKVFHSDDKNVYLHDFGPIKKLLGKLDNILTLLNNHSSQKKWRSYEMEVFKRFQCYFYTLKNPSVPIDESKMNYLLKISKIEPLKKSKIPWQECLMSISLEAKALFKKISYFDSLSWVKSYRNISVEA